jgi:PAS domain S-box-containing protein
VLHEFSSFALTKSEEQLAAEAVEKVARLFGVRYFGIVSRVFHHQRLIAAWGLSSLAQALAKLEQCADKPGFLKLSFSEGTEDEDVIFFEQARTITDRERWLYNVCARRLANRLTAFRLRAKHRQAMDALRESEKLLRESQEIAGIGSYTVDLGGDICQSSAALNQLLGIPRQEKHPLAIWPSLIHPEWQKQVLQAHRLAMEKGGRFDQEYKIIRQNDGQERWVHDVGRFENDAQGRPARLVGTIMDITERKRMEQDRDKLRTRLFQAQKMETLGILAGGIAHDFNNLLQIMGGNLQLLLQKNQGHPDIVRLKTLEKNVDRAAQLVRQLLLFCRKAEIRMKRMDLNLEIRETAELLKRTLPKMIAVVLQLAERLWPIQADPVQIEQVLLNLGSNAADAMPDGGRLVIETVNVVLDPEFAKTYLDLKPGPYVLMSVSDTGCGMDKTVLERIFEPFFTTKEIGKGTGLGLSTAYGIIKEHGGHILCYSEPNLGTTFKIYWPALSNGDALENSAVPAHGEHRGCSETILVVDDEAAILELASEVLTSCGYTVLTAASAEEALAVYAGKARSIDLVILDLNMPGMGGRQGLEELLGLDPGARVLIASGYSDAKQIQAILEAGALGFIGKPYQLAELTAKMREVLDSAKGCFNRV